MKLTSPNKALLAGVSGTVLQWYDFAIFVYFAPIIAATYFPSSNNLASLLNTFSVFAVGYLMAPLGSVLFGYIGDRYGRKIALTSSIFVMGVSTALISIVPSYHHIGASAPILITLLRVIQGFVGSSEFTGSAIFLVEHANPERKAFYGCLTSSAYSFGSILAGIAASLLTAAFMPQWAWRLGFAVSLIGGILVFYLRINVNETPEYRRISANQKLKFPLFSALKEIPLAVVGVVGLAWLVSIMTFGTYVFAATYLYTYFNISLSLGTLIVTLSLTVDALLEPFVAFLADKFGSLPIIKFGMMALFFLSVPIFHLISTGNLIYIIIAMVLMSVLIAITYAPLNAYMVSLFPHQYRYSGFSVSFNTGISVFGGTVPLVLMWLIQKTGNLIAPSWYYMVGAVVGLGSLMICEYSRRRIHVYSIHSLSDVAEDVI